MVEVGRGLAPAKARREARSRLWLVRRCIWCLLIDDTVDTLVDVVGK